MGLFIASFLLIWPLAALFTLIQKIITKRVTRRTIIITTLIAGALFIIGGLFSPTAEYTWSHYLAIVIATAVVLRVRLSGFEKKSKQENKIEPKV